ncbi:MAG: hypothetical protein NXH75_03990 [Halobacteriovoraceae bacterium]|nr:hypothetical protein [Halobacteriovoraceae bacterium]
MNSNAKLPSQTEHTSSQDHLLSGRLYFSNGYMLSTSLWANQDFQNEKELRVRDSLLMLTKPIGNLTNNISFTARGGLTLPLSEQSNKFSGLITAIRFNPIFSINASDLIPSLRVIYRPSFVYNIHEYNQQVSGESNTEYSINQRLTILYPLLDNLYLSFDNTYIRWTSYLGSETDIFSFDQSLSTNLTKNLNLFFGHNIGGNALAINGQESDVRIFDIEDGSEYYIGISYQF